MCQGSLLKETHKNNGQVVKFLYKYAQENVAYIKIAVKDEFYTKVKKDLEITRLEFFNGVGGMLGLCLGLSLISVYEMIFHLAKFMFRNHCCSTYGSEEPVNVRNPDH